MSTPAVLACPFAWAALKPGKHQDRHSPPIPWERTQESWQRHGSRTRTGPIQDMNRHNYESELPIPSQHAIACSGQSSLEKLYYLPIMWKHGNGVMTSVITINPR